MPEAPYLEGSRSAEEDFTSLEVRNKYKKANLYSGGDTRRALFIVGLFPDHCKH